MMVIFLDKGIIGNEDDLRNHLKTILADTKGREIIKELASISTVDADDIGQLLRLIKGKKAEELGIGIRIKTLKEYKLFLESNLDKNEKFIQDWLDEEDGKYRKQRCLIFGLEFTDHKREGELCRKRFDVLTRTGDLNNEYVIFELKSPCDDVFSVKEVDNFNGGKSTEFHLSPQVSRSIPQILHYKNLIESKTEADDDLQRIGITPGKVKKCIVLIGTRKSDHIWVENFRNLRNNLSNTLEIWTYTDLIEKLGTTIKNLEENL